MQTEKNNQTNIETVIRQTKIRIAHLEREQSGIEVLIKVSSFLENFGEGYDIVKLLKTELYQNKVKCATANDILKNAVANLNELKS